MNTLPFALAFLALPSFAQTTITLQPGPQDGKDAPLFSCIPCGFSTTNYETYHKFSAAAWTNQGANSDTKSVIEFDLSAIPTGATILSAELSLFFNPDDASGPHSSLTNSNASYLRRITTPWDESTVTWDTQPSITTVNQVTLPESTSPTQHYSDIDVSNLVQDIINDPANSFGFMLESISDQEYHGLYFASSDHAVAALHPKLVVTYEVGVSTTHEMEAVDFSIYPNPTKDILTVSCSASIERLEIMDNAGRVIDYLDHSETTVDVQDLSSGSYFLKLHTLQGIGMKQFIIE